MATKLGTVLADFSTSLATAIIVGGTTSTLQSATDDDGVALPSGRYFFTIDGDNSNKEHFSCDLSGTSLTNLKSVSRQGVETTGAARAHRIGSTVWLTDFAHLKFINDLLSGSTTFNASVPLGYDGTASITTNNQFATKAYVDGIAISGSPDATTTTKGVSKMSVAPASPTAPIAVGDNDPRIPTQSENDALQGSNGTPSGSNRFLTQTDQTGSNMPPGTLLMYAGSSIPTGWLLCTGAIGAISRTTYAALFAAIGTAYGAGNGSTTFNIPNFETRVPVGRGNSPFNSLGNTGGEETHLLTAAESGVPAHTHTFTTYGNVGSAAPPQKSDGSNTPVSTSTDANTPANASSAHNNLQPYIVVNYIIKT